ncbi:MAG TPA: ATP-binding protein [Chthoniobacteraceae bacterium]|nr:ATP-binding protein [Chthoniobacteraceae bacterium]
MSAPLPHNEQGRLRALRSYHLLDSEPEPSFDQITALASYLLDTPMAMISLLDAERQWFKSHVGFSGKEMPRDEAICSYTILSPEALVIPDVLTDDRFSRYPRVESYPWIRFYAGIPLRTPEGYALGTLCVLDTQPRNGLKREQLEILSVLAQETMAYADLRRASRILSKALMKRKQSDLLQALSCRLASSISTAPDVTGALQATLDGLCNQVGWGRGSAWMKSGDEGRCLLICQGRRTGPAGHFGLLPVGENGGNGGNGGNGSPGGNGHSHRVSEALIRRAWDDGRSAMEYDPRLSLGEAVFPLAGEEGDRVIFAFLTDEPEAEARRMLDETAKVMAHLAPELARKHLDEQLRRQEAELARANQMKDHFLAMLAHEMRNPLAPILNAVELLKTGDSGDALELIERQVHHMSRLMEDLLDISRVSRGKITLHKKTIDLARTVQEATRTAHELFSGRGQPFEVILPAVPLWVEADPVRIEQVVGNLLHNAAKYSGRGQPVALMLECEGTEARLCVKDHGVGIPAEALQQIFEPFVQVDGSRPMAKGGLGLGLALVRQLVALHGGRVQARSAGPGRGSEFCVYLPLADPPAVLEEEPDVVVEKIGGTMPCRVLVVEDHDDLAATLHRLLTHWGHVVERVSRGSLALQRALAMQPDVVLIDIGLPDVDGYTVARQFMASETLSRRVRLIAITGYGQEADRLAALEAGFDVYLLKPVDPIQLREWVRRKNG